MSGVGLIQLYHGDGKGKTSAAIGASIRAAGAGKKVLFAQFLKDGSSSEIHILQAVPGIKTLHCDTVQGFWHSLSPEQQARARADYEEFLELVLSQASRADLLVLDELSHACRLNVISEIRLISWLEKKPEGLEVIITGRDPSPALKALADYESEIKKIRHPFDRGIAARKGIEF